MIRLGLVWGKPPVDMSGAPALDGRQIGGDSGASMSPTLRPAGPGSGVAAGVIHREKQDSPFS